MFSEGEAIPIPINDNPPSGDEALRQRTRDEAATHRGTAILAVLFIPINREKPVPRPEDSRLRRVWLNEFFGFEVRRIQWTTGRWMMDDSSVTEGGRCGEIGSGSRLTRGMGILPVRFTGVRLCGGRSCFGEGLPPVEEDDL